MIQSVLKYCIYHQYVTQGEPLGATPDFKTNYMINLGKFSSKKPILDPKVSLDRILQDLKLVTDGNLLEVILGL